MDPMDYLSVRFHYRGRFELVDRELIYKGGKKGMSIVLISMLSISELKKHLSDRVSCSEEVMARTELSWKMPASLENSALVPLRDQKSVILMAKQCTDAGVMDVYAQIPLDIAADESGDGLDEAAAMQQENAPFHHDLQQENSPMEHDQEEETRRCPTMDEKGKGIQEGTDSEDSDYCYVLEAEDSNNSADDEEAKNYREQATELKRKVRAKMLGDEVVKNCDVPDDFIVPENCKDGDEADDSPYFDTEDELSYSEGSDGEVQTVRTRKTKHRVYDETTEVQEFELGQAFTDSRQFKNALVNYGMKHFHHLKFPKDERTRVSAKCSVVGCPWSIYGSITGKSTWLIVSRYVNMHTCVPRRDNALVTSTVIAKKYFRQIRDNPGWKVEKMQEAVLEDMCADVSTAKCKRAKKLVMEKLIDSTNGEFSRVFDYHLEIIRSNPGSTVAVTLNPDILDKPVFQRMYACFDACKKGFLAGCRRVLGLDGCFPKGSVSGQLLCAIGRDANNQMYPIAWATMEQEHYDSWYWFLALLQKDIQINNNGEGWVVISDQQKGLIKAVNEIIPQAGHMMCARHIYANWRKLHRDKLFQKIFWACAKASDVVGFNYHKARLSEKTEEGAKDMMKTSPEHWSRAYFKFGSYCDSVENNLCESFNNAIMRARFYPIITSMETIRKKVMVRIQENRARSNNWTGTICPNIFKKLKLNISRSNICTVLWNGKEGFEVSQGGWRNFTVNLDKMTCSCRYWQLSGLPCPHAISAIYAVHRKLDDYIAPCYRISEYNKIHDHVMQPMEGKENWPVATNPQPHPSIGKNAPGRPKTERRREEGEKPKGTKLSRKGCIIRCSSCGSTQHNKRKCTANPNAGAKEHASFTKAAKQSRKKKDNANQREASNAQANHAPAATQSHGTTPAKLQPKRKKQKGNVTGQSSSQPVPDPTFNISQPTSRQGNFSQEPVMQIPTEGRLRWWFFGNEGQGGDDAPDGV